MTLLDRRCRRKIVFVCGCVVCAAAGAQSPAGQAHPRPSSSSSSTQPSALPPGQVLVQSHGAETTTEGASPGNPEQQASPDTSPAAKDAAGAPQLTDADRAAIRIASYDLDVRITPATAHLIGRARMTLRNTSDVPLARIALQISSTLAWQSATLLRAAPETSLRLPIAQHRLDTDADHTGQASELVLALPIPLAPQAAITLDVFYAGTIAASGGRLERMGAAPDQALATDWDAIIPDATALRGFGNVLWFPVAAPQLFLSDGSLVPAIDRERLQHASTPVHLRLSIQYTGEAPVAAYFCGRRQPLKAFADDADLPVASGSGIATANFPVEPIGPRPLSLFVLSHPETMIAPVPISSASNIAAPPAFSSSSGEVAAPHAAMRDGPPMLAVETSDDSVLDPLAASAERVAPLLVDWFGPHPLSALTVIDHAGQPFEDGPLLVAPLHSLSAPAAAPLLAHSLTHAWVQTGQPWMDEGLAEFFSLLWTEREKGRDAAVAQLDALMQPVIAADSSSAPQAASAGSAISPSSASQAEVSFGGQPLIHASDEIFYRRKAGAVWWMLRDIAGQQPLQLALSAWRTQSVSHESAEEQARGFERLLEKTSRKDLAWFFNDWVFHDRGLPTLSIVDVTPSQLPAGAGHDSGWLVAVTMRNQGDAAAEVPLLVRSGSFSVTKRIRIPGRSSITYREVVGSTPNEVVLNDGSTPETGVMVHTRAVVTKSE